MITLEGEFRGRRYPLTLRDGVLHGAFGPVAFDVRVWVVYDDGETEDAHLTECSLAMCGYRNVATEQREGAAR